ncbi:hypothetical protein HII36_26865 [Nonomuraea sp. NN258]|uniref:hypothetical protein n=1 Tax=Nonomuraea antri TaxID=2730852 RepID=UPI001568AD12|nr:hypothetical protein [Nonomuraea antri]NRQ35424.1 hypothetical protein [Nonomuraea antri]
MAVIAWTGMACAAMDVIAAYPFRWLASEAAASCAALMGELRNVLDGWLLGVPEWMHATLLAMFGLNPGQPAAVWLEFPPWLLLLVVVGLLRRLARKLVPWYEPVRPARNGALKVTAKLGVKLVRVLGFLMILLCFFALMEWVTLDAGEEDRTPGADFVFTVFLTLMVWTSEIWLREAWLNRWGVQTMARLVDSAENSYLMPFTEYRTEYGMEGYGTYQYTSYRPYHDMVFLLAGSHPLTGVQVFFVTRDVPKKLLTEVRFDPDDPKFNDL